MESLSDKKSAFLKHQQQLQRQVKIIDLLETEFLGHLWSTPPATPKALHDRFKRLSTKLDNAGPLDPAMVMQIFSGLEHRALVEINKLALLSQTTEPQALANECPELPAELIKNALAAHEQVYKTRQSKENRKSASQKRPGAHHADRERVENELKKRIENKAFDIGRRGDQASFIRNILALYPRLNREETIRLWIKELLEANKA